MLKGKIPFFSAGALRFCVEIACCLKLIIIPSTLIKFHVKKSSSKADTAISMLHRGCGVLLVSSMFLLCQTYDVFTLNSSPKMILTVFHLNLYKLQFQNVFVCACCCEIERERKRECTAPKCIIYYHLFLLTSISPCSQTPPSGSCLFFPLFPIFLLLHCHIPHS